MSIRTRLRFLIGALLAAAALILLLMFNAYTKIESDLVESASANQIARDIFALNILLHDFVATHEERPRIQWQNAYAQLGRDIKRINNSDLNPNEARWLAQIEENYPLLQKLFSGLIQAYKTPENVGQDPAERMLAQALLLRTSIIVQAANQLSVLSLQEIRITKRNTFTMMVIAALFLLTIIGLLFMTKRHIARSLKTLQTGAATLGAGDFAHPIHLPGHDEFALLASSFNAMAHQLGGSYQKLQASNTSLHLALEEREAKDLALALMAKRLSLATKAAAIGVWDWDVLSNKLYWDDNMYRLYDLPPTISPDYGTWRAAVHPEDFALTEADLLRTLANKSQGEREFRTLRRNGEVRYLHSAETVVTNAQGMATNVIGINMDVTERKITVDAMQRISTLQRAILDSANFSIISTDIVGTIRVFNESAQRMLGYSAEEVVNQVSPALLHDPEEVAARAKILTHELGYSVAPGFETFVAKARLGAADENEWTYIRKDGSRFPVLLSSEYAWGNRRLLRRGL